jgi:hypothetical protein
MAAEKGRCIGNWQCAMLIAPPATMDALKRLNEEGTVLSTMYQMLMA